MLLLPPQVEVYANSCPTERHASLLLLGLL
jgi:hypothetical protein